MMSTPFAMILILLGVAVGAVFAWLAGRSKSAALAARCSSLQAEAAAVKTELVNQQTEGSALANPTRRSKLPFWPNVEARKRKSGC